MLKDLFNTKYARPLIIVVILVVGVLAASLGSHHNSKTAPRLACGAYRTDKVVTIHNQKINAEVVESPVDKAKGLSGRPCVGNNQGMLFVYTRPGYYSFWMKDMKFPIDIIWISADHKTAGVERNVQTNTYPGSKFINDRQHPAQYVLELKANRSNTLNITLGTPINF